MKRTRAPWTALVYFAGERDLAESMVLSLKEMYRVGRANRCRVFAQFNAVDSAPRRFTIGNSVEHRRPSSSNPLPRDQDGRLPRMGEILSIDSPSDAANNGVRKPQATIHRATLESFIVSGINENPSDHYLLVLSGHASGVVGRGRDQDGFCPGAMRTLDLGPMLDSVKQRTGRKVDVLGMDACFMSMCEVCWELRNAVGFLVASEGLTPQYGWPYHRILELFRDGDDLRPRDVASAIVSRYLRYRADFDLAGQSIDLSACELARTGKLADALKRLCHAMEARLADSAFRDVLVLSHWKAQSYKSEQYVDLWDFCHLLRRQCGDELIRVLCEGVRKAVSSPRFGAVIKSVFHGPEYQHSHGLSIYFPWSVVAPGYGDFGFTQKTGWQRFLQKYVLATRRELRRDVRRSAS